MSNFAAWSADPIGWELRMLRCFFGNRRRYAPGSYGRRYCSSEALRHLHRIRALRHGGMLGLSGVA